MSSLSEVLTSFNKDLSSTGQGFHLVEFVFGVLLGLAALAGLALVVKRATRRHWQRRQTAAVMDTLKDLKREDVERLLKQKNDMPTYLAQRLRTSSDEVSVQWCNGLVRQMWGQIAAVCEEMLREQIADVLNANKPAWIAGLHLDRVSLGQQPPVFTDVHVVDAGQAGSTPRKRRPRSAAPGSQNRSNSGSAAASSGHREDQLGDKGQAAGSKGEAIKPPGAEGEDFGPSKEVAFELGVQWEGSQDVSIAITLLPRRLGLATLLVRIMSALLKLKVGVDKIRLRGKLRVTLPLFNELPCVAGIQVAFVEMPKFHFDLNVYGGDVTFLPGIEQWLRHVAREKVLRAYTLPQRYTYALDPQRLAALEAPRGMLTVRLVDARDVPRMDLLSKTDCYCKLSVGSGLVLSSQVRKGTLEPSWGEDFRLLVREPATQRLVVDLYDWDRFNADDHIGGVEVPIAELGSGRTRDLWLDVQPPEAEETSASRVPGASAARSRRKEAKESKHAERLHKNGRQCRVHLLVTYLEFSAKEVAEARKVAAHGGDPGGTGGQDSELVRMLRGGALDVKVVSAGGLHSDTWFKFGWTSRISVMARVEGMDGGDKKQTQVVSGSKPSFNQTLEFVVTPAAPAHGSGGDLVLVVWDKYLFKECLGEVRIPMARIREECTLTGHFALRSRRERSGSRPQGTRDDGEEEEEDMPLGYLNLEIRWLGFLQGT
ncbi:hypothetical protein WJX81_007714 [Elliptochloris bilobata]|uniref:Plant synaptotagmin n=1 Tax=Elliptochloris bilobata TaxID=381761 RepID=A0AAW1RXN6_9CHLO